MTIKKLINTTYLTPFHELKNLQMKLGIKPRIFVKRDDLTAVGLGGNKNRKLDYIMYDAVSKGADTIITWGGIQSNHCRQVAAYANLLGMKCHLVLNGTPPAKKKGNLFLYELFGAEIYYEPKREKCDVICGEIAESSKSVGKNPYIIPLGGSTALGSIGYVDCIKEIKEQSSHLDLNFSHIFVATGSAGTQAGVEVGVKKYFSQCKVQGISVSHPEREQREKVSALSNKVSSLLEENFHFTSNDISVCDNYIGKEYGIATETGNEAVKLLAETEGIILDPVYTGKVMSGMIDLLKAGTYDQSEAIIFIHTGGGPAIHQFTKYFV